MVKGPCRWHVRGVGPVVRMVKGEGGCILYLTGPVGKGCIELARCGRVCITDPGMSGCSWLALLGWVQRTGLV
jgi:hypothetical protein